jgi:beta-galactosidase
MQEEATMPNSLEILGAEIQYFRLDPRYWERVLQRFAETSLGCVTTYVQWSTHLVGEPDAAHPAGVLDFEGRSDPRLNLRRFLELVERHGLRLNFRCGPFCCNEMVHGGYPHWLVLGDPGIMVWDWQNRTTQGYWIGKREGSQPSYLHPTYLEWVVRWFEAVDPILVEHLHSRGGCVTMVNLDNEISYICQDGFLSSDYNPVNVAPGGFYHQFLTQKYGSADNLPYPRRYAAIEEVPAPRAVPETVGEDLAYYTDWCEFKTWVMCEYLRRLRAMHEANGVRDVTFMTNFNPHLPEGVPTRMPDFEKATGGIVGYDFYRGTFMSYSGYHSMARVLKLMNASLKYTWSAEFMSGTWNLVGW